MHSCAGHLWQATRMQWQTVKCKMGITGRAMHAGKLSRLYAQCPFLWYRQSQDISPSILQVLSLLCQPSLVLRCGLSCCAGSRMTSPSSCSSLPLHHWKPSSTSPLQEGTLLSSLAGDMHTLNSSTRPAFIVFARQHLTGVQAEPCWPCLLL